MSEPETDGTDHCEQCLGFGYDDAPANLHPCPECGGTGRSVDTETARDGDAS